jgi:hypothetical protein
MRSSNRESRNAKLDKHWFAQKLNRLGYPASIARQGAQDSIMQHEERRLERERRSL